MQADELEQNFWHSLVLMENSVGQWCKTQIGLCVEKSDTAVSSNLGFVKIVRSPTIRNSGEETFAIHASKTRTRQIPAKSGCRGSNSRDKAFSCEADRRSLGDGYSYPSDKYAVLETWRGNIVRGVPWSDGNWGTRTSLTSSRYSFPLFPRVKL